MTSTGQTYKVVWDVGSTTYTGSAIGNKDFIAVYLSGDNTELALYREDGSNWRSAWAYAGGTSIGAACFEICLEAYSSR